MVPFGQHARNYSLGAKVRALEDDAVDYSLGAKVRALEDDAVEERPEEAPHSSAHHTGHEHGHVHKHGLVDLPAPTRTRGG